VCSPSSGSACRRAAAVQVQHAPLLTALPVRKCDELPCSRFLEKNGRGGKGRRLNGNEPRGRGGSRSKLATGKQKWYASALNVSRWSGGAFAYIETNLASVSSAVRRRQLDLLIKKERKEGTTLSTWQWHIAKATRSNDSSMPHPLGFHLTYLHAGEPRSGDDSAPGRSRRARRTFSSMNSSFDGDARRTEGTPCTGSDCFLSALVTCLGERDDY
jgi:hypothetical protein